MGSLTFVRGFLECKLHEHTSRQNIMKLQQKKVQKLLTHAFHHSPFYHNLYQSAGITSENLTSIALTDVPIVDKAMIMDHFDQVLTVPDITKQKIHRFLDSCKDPTELLDNRYHIIHTSGSSGKIGIFIYNKKEWDYFFPFITRVFNFHFRRNRSAFFGATNGHFAGVSFSLWLGKNITRLFVSPLILDITKPLKEHVEKLNHFQPTILGGYFMGLKLLAEQQENGTLHIHPTQIVNCGEAVLEHEKTYIEHIFHAPLTNLYGLAECIILGAGKNEYQGIYLMEDLAIIEIQQDSILLTNLFNTTQPLIRYKVPDIFIKKQDTQHHLPFTLVDTIIGRNESLLWLQNDEGNLDFIHPIVISEIYTKGLDKLQIILHNPTFFEFHAVIKDTKPQEVIKNLQEQIDKILTEKHFSSVHYHIKIVDTLEIDKKTGKFQLIIEKT